MIKYEYAAFGASVSTKDQGFGYYMDYPITEDWEFVGLTMLNTRMHMIFRRAIND